MGARLARPGNYESRPPDFWRDFQITVISDKKTGSQPFDYTGEPDYGCDDGGCTLVGATVKLEFLTDALSVRLDATIQLDPPEGDQVVVDFDLSTLR